MKRNLSVLGSTGSIGTQTLDVARNLGIRICALAAGRNIRLLEQQIREFRPALAAVSDPDAAAALKTAVADLPVKIVAGMDGVCEAASIADADLVCNSIVGMVGLRPTLAAIHAKKDVALANKETLVAGGEIVMREAAEAGVRIFPVDSEHSAIFQCLQGCPNEKALKTILLTASGGPFYGKTAEELRNVTPQQALHHPNWNMGPKVTIDSATMMNKGLEIIEASWLFNLTPDRIQVLVQRQSIVHSMIEYEDNSVIAQLGVADMRIPIQYAVTWPDRFPSPVARLDLAKIGTLTFSLPDENTFRCLRACRRALARGGLAPAAANGANEAVVKLFLDGKIPFLQIGELVEAAMERQPDTHGVFSIDEVFEADGEARKFVLSEAGK